MEQPVPLDRRRVFHVKVRGGMGVNITALQECCQQTDRPPKARQSVEFKDKGRNDEEDDVPEKMAAP
jgi:hypothetical protein